MFLKSKAISHGKVCGFALSAVCVCDIKIKSCFLFFFRVFFPINIFLQRAKI